MRQVAGVILVGLAILKAAGLIVVVAQGAPDRSTQWIMKQAMYAVAAASIGWPLLRHKQNGDAQE